jgi:WD40 repeat protein
MPGSLETLADLVGGAIVMISHGGGIGTGFFVAPGWILTCAHVLREQSGCHQSIKFRWNGADYDGVLHHVLPDPWSGADLLPDLALISHDLQQTPLLPLQPGYKGREAVMSIGFLEGKGKDSLEGKCEGYREYGETPEHRLIKFARTQVGHGISGSPLMNRRTRAVCGVVKRTRDEETDLGGLAVPIERALEAWPDICKATPVAVGSASALPLNYVPRPQALDSIREKVLGAQTGNKLPFTALYGMGGIGKTVLAEALCRDPVIQQAFPDGCIWVEIGKEWRTDPTERLHAVLRVLDGDYKAESFTTGDSRKAAYRTLIRDKAALIVLDDVWQSREIEPFVAESSSSRLIFTTRSRSIAAGMAEQEYAVELLTPQQSLEVLSRSSAVEVSQMPPEANDLVRECGLLPLALAMVGAALRGKPLPAWKYKVQQLRSADLEKIRASIDYAHVNLLSAIQVSVDDLGDNLRDRYLILAVLLEQMAAHPLVQQTLWGCDETEAYDIADQLVNLSLALFEGAEGAIRLHDLQLDYVRAKYPDQEPLRIIHSAVQLARHVISLDPAQFASQVVGRLASQDDRAEIRRFSERLKKYSPRPWLRPIGNSLISPGGALIGSLQGHSDEVGAVAVTPGGRRAVSASRDCTLRVWDIESERELHVLRGHSGEVKAVAVTQNGQRAISASKDRTLRVWDLEGGDELQVLHGHSGEVNAVAVTLDGRRAISASDDRTLRVWDLESGDELQVLHGHSGEVRVVAVTGDHAISGSTDRSLRIWDLNNGRLLQTLEGSRHQIEAVAVATDGRRAVSASGTRLKVWDLENGHELRALEGHSADVLAVVIAPDGRRAISASEDDTLRVWDLESGRELHTLEGHSAGVLAVVMTPDGRAISASEDCTLRVWDLQSGHNLHTLEGHSKSINAVAVTPDGNWVISASDDHTLKVWDLNRGDESHILRGHSASTQALAVTPDASRAISASGDGTLKTWALDKDGSELHTLRGEWNSPHALAVTPDGRKVVAASWYKDLIVWDIESGSELHTLDGHPSFIYAVAVTPDGRLLISSGFDSLRVWDLDSGRELRTLDGSSTGEGDERLVLSVTPDGQKAISSSAATNLKIWEINSGNELHTLSGHSHFVTAVAVTPDGRLAVSASRDQTLKVWDISNGHEIHTLKGHLDQVLAVAVTSDGCRAVSASMDHTLRIWDLYSGRQLHVLEGHADWVRRVVVTPNGRCAISTSNDQTLKVWDLESGLVVATFTCDFATLGCACAGRRIIAGDEGGRVHLLELEE